jgi:hypothetical protein
VDCGHPSAQTESGMTDECSLTEKGHGQRMIYKLTERGESLWVWFLLSLISGNCILPGLVKG